MCFWDSDFPFRMLDKKIYSEFADSRKEKKRVQRDNQSAEGAGGLGITRDNKLGESE